MMTVMTQLAAAGNDSLRLSLGRNCSLTSLTLTINNFSPRSTGLSPTLIGCLEGCSSLKSLTLTLKRVQYVGGYLCIPSAGGPGTQHLTVISDFDTQHLRWGET